MVKVKEDGAAALVKEKEDDGEVLNGWGLLLPSDPLRLKIVALVALVGLVAVGCDRDRGRGCGCG